MTVHEYHIALVLIALITAGVLGYHSLNADMNRSSQDCSWGLYFSDTDNCSDIIKTESISARAFTESVEIYSSPEKNIMFDLHMNTIEYNCENRLTNTAKVAREMKSNQRQPHLWMIWHCRQF